jgi:hypothetical protein
MPYTLYYGSGGISCAEQWLVSKKPAFEANGQTYSNYSTAADSQGKTTPYICDPSSSSCYTIQMDNDNIITAYNSWCNDPTGMPTEECMSFENETHSYGQCST